MVHIFYERGHPRMAFPSPSLGCMCTINNRSLLETPLPDSYVAFYPHSFGVRPCERCCPFILQVNIYTYVPRLQKILQQFKIGFIMRKRSAYIFVDRLMSHYCNVRNFTYVRCLVYLNESQSLVSVLKFSRVKVIYERWWLSIFIPTVMILF